MDLDGGGREAAPFANDGSKHLARDLMAIVIGWSADFAVIGVTLPWGFLIASSDVNPNFATLGAIGGSIGGALTYDERFEHRSRFNLEFLDLSIQAD